MLESILDLFREPEKLPKYEEIYAPDDDPTVRRIVAAIARGNINLQRGRYITEEQISKLREKVLSREDEDET